MTSYSAGCHFSMFTLELVIFIHMFILLFIFIFKENAYIFDISFGILGFIGGITISLFILLHGIFLSSLYLTLFIRLYFIYFISDDG